MGKQKYIIRTKKPTITDESQPMEYIYYHSMLGDVAHCVADIDDAYLCKDKWCAKRIIKKLSSVHKYEIIPCGKYNKRR